MIIKIPSLEDIYFILIKNHVTFVSQGNRLAFLIAYFMLLTNVTFLRLSKTFTLSCMRADIRYNN